MKTTSVVLALCLALLGTSGHAARIQRSLKQNSVSVSSSASCVVVNGRCRASARVSSQAINDAAASISVALSTAIAVADGGGDAQAAAVSFAQAIARAYAVVISSHTLSVFVEGQGTACAYTRSNGQSYATAFAQAVSIAFAQSSNEYARAAATCFSQAVASASVTAVQNANYGTCTNYGSNFIYRRLETVGYVEAIATTFGAVFAAIRNNDPIAAAACEASAVANSGMSTRITGFGSG